MTCEICDMKDREGLWIVNDKARCSYCSNGLDLDELVKPDVYYIKDESHIIKDTIFILEETNQ